MFVIRAFSGRRGFEITSKWLTFRPLRKLLRSVPGVTVVRRQWFNVNRIVFKFHGLHAVGSGPSGDSSPDWVGLQHPEAFHRR